MHAAGLYPSQLFESAGGLVIAGILFMLLRGKFFNGFLFYMMGILYAVLRFAVDYSRYYGPGEHLGPFSHNQVICIIMFVIFGSLIVKNLVFGKSEQKPSTPVQSSIPVNEPAESVAKK
jgi:prolipoprotein diacylglyceryltransferase